MNVIYARQSIDKKDSLSIEAQISLCKKLAGDDAKVYSDKGYSGKNTKRPAFTELINDIKAGRIEKIYTYRLDRFSRSIGDFSKLWELLEQNGVEFVSATENFDTSNPMGRAMLNIVLVFAQLERETTAKRVKDNYVHRFKLGAWTGGPAPFGYNLTKIIDDGKKVSSLIKNENSKTVKFIFEEYIKPNATLRSIALKLNEKGIHGPKREIWDNVTISRILHSPIYVRADKDVYLHYLTKGLQIEQNAEMFDGIHACNIICRRDHTKNKYNSLKDRLLSVSNHEGFIDTELWLRVQEKLSENRQLPRNNAGKYSWLTGLLKCKKCGYALKINYQKKENKYFLICSGKSNFAICDCRVSVDLRELENYVENKIDKLLRESPPAEAIPIDNNVSAKVLETEEKINRLVNAIAESSEIAVFYINKQIEILHKEREKLFKKSEGKPKSVKTIDFKMLSFEEKKLVAAQFIEKISIEGKDVNIVWKI